MDFMRPEWVSGLLGGLLVGAAGALYLLGNARIMGASGILGGVVDGSSSGRERIEKIVMMAGMVLTPFLLIGVGIGQRHPAVSGTLGLVIAGLLVGIGTRLANGCTSGHGVCGISRLSIRGIAATCTFLGFGVIGVLIARALGLGV